MKKMLKLLDAWILAQHTRLAHWIQQRTGRTSFTLAKIAATHMALFWTALIIAEAKPGETSLVWLALLGGNLYCIFELRDCALEEKKFLAAIRDGATVPDQSQRDSDWKLRLCYVGLFLGTLGGTAYWMVFGGRSLKIENYLAIAVGLSSTLYIYLAAVNPLPPAQDREKGKRERKRKLVPASVPS